MKERSENPRVLFVSLSRGGSKGIPGKNLREVGGIPLVGRAARLGRRCLERLGGNGRVVVSTDDESLARVARQYGAETPFARPPELARDDTPSLPVVLHVLERLAGAGDQFDEVVLLQPTAPLVSVEDVLGCVELFRRLKGPAVVAVTGTREPADLHFRMNGTLLERVATADVAIARQNRPNEVVLSGGVYVSTPEWLKDEGHWMKPGKTHGYPISAEHGVDVDEPSDLAIARALHEQGLPWGSGRVMVIAEAGVNHNGDYGRALELVDAAAEAGADAVKFQMFRAEALCSAVTPQAEYQTRNTGTRGDMRALLQGLELPVDAFRGLSERCRERGVMFSASVFDEQSLDDLDRLAPRFIKIPSGEITNLTLLRAAARTLKPLVISTGMSGMGEVAAAMEAIRDAGGTDVVLLHCTSAYPCPVESCNLRAIQTLGQAFGVPVGFSDHTVGFEAVQAAVALGSRVVEKHFTLDRTLPGPDHAASLTPPELADYIRSIRQMEQAMGSGLKEMAEVERNTAAVARKSLVAAVDLPMGKALTEKDLVCKRPGTGIPPGLLAHVAGRIVRRAIRRDELIRWEDLG